MQNVLIADDHAVTRRGIRELLREAYPDVDVVEVGDGEAVLATLDARPWDLVLLDVVMPGASVLDVLRTLRQTHTTVPVLVLTAATEIEYVIETMQAGANGLIHKHRASDELLGAVRMVAGGGTYLHPETAAVVASGLRQSKPPKVHDGLSARELEIFVLIARGRAIKEIAGDLGISDKTVATYLGRIRDKTGLATHVDIARYALLNGLVD